MHFLNRPINRFTVALFSYSLIVVSFFPALAYGPTEPTGPQEPTGVQTETGIIGPVGIVSPTGRVQEDSAVSAEAGSELLSNTDTGSESVNTNTSTTSSSTNADVANSATIDNTISADMNSGQNDISRNTEVGDVAIEGTQGSVTVVNIANSQLAPGSSIGSQTIAAPINGNVFINPSGNQSSLIALNDNTGSGSTNNNTSNNSQAVQILTRNDASALNDLSVSVNQGDNLITDNTRVGNVTIGGIDFNANFINLLNLSGYDIDIEVASIEGDVNGDIIIPALANSFTGAGSRNINTINGTGTTDINVLQDADINNDFNYNINNGENVFADNTGLGNVDIEGNVIDGRIVNLANTSLPPIFYIFNVFGQCECSFAGLDPGSFAVNSLSNSHTGADSLNVNRSTSENTLDITSESIGNVQNRLNFEANNGRNRFERNTAVGDVTIGGITAFTNVVNAVNSFARDVQNFTIGIVNIFGNWRGTARTNEQLPSSSTATPTVTSVTSGAATTTTQITTGSDTQSVVASAASSPEEVERLSSSSTTRTARRTRELSSAYMGSTDQTPPSATAESESSINASENSNIAQSLQQAQIPEPKSSPTSSFPLIVGGSVVALFWGVIELIAALQGRAGTLLR